MEEDFRFSDIVKYANDIVVVTKTRQDDVTHQEIVYVNTAFTTITEYTAEEAIGKKAKLLELFGSDEEAKNNVRQSLRDNKPVRATAQSRTKSGKKLWIDISIVPIKNGQGDYAYFASIERDVTNEKNLLIELDQLSNQDPLTGLYNRRALNKEIEQELSRFHRSGIPFSFILLDLDHFKAINDTYGHSAGDKVLQEISDLIKHEKREYDFAARIGGEEICIMLPDAPLEQAMNFSERLRKLISETCVSQGNENIKVTTSIGVTEVITEDDSIESIFNRADEALYEAKATGRNRIISATTSNN
ncbi:MAG: sensor domain-containing diguanylate cyclase [Proteobacteria bacterium]|nr:sensor domain-containing diguanylate cyclase [Pseudomonadota bacterium]